MTSHCTLHPGDGDERQAHKALRHPPQQKDSSTLSLLFFYSLFSLSDIGLQFKCFAVCPSAHASVFTQFVNETTKLNTIMSLTILNYIDSFTNDEVLTTSAGLHEASNRHIA
jgi:hypothetical protein